MRRMYTTKVPFDAPKAANFKWNLSSEVERQLGFEEQYLSLQRHLLKNLITTDWANNSDCANKSESEQQLKSSLRAGAIKSYVVFSASIIEGVLAALAEKFDLPKKNIRRDFFKMTLGELLEFWMSNGKAKAQIEDICSDLELIIEYRNFIHLQNASNNPKAYWQAINKNEAQLLAKIDKTIKHLRDISLSKSL